MLLLLLVLCLHYFFVSKNHIMGLSARVRGSKGAAVSLSVPRFGEMPCWFV